MTAVHCVENDTDCKQEDRLTTCERELGDLNKVVWRGNGTPSLVAQMAVMSQTVKALCWLVGGACMAVLGQIVVLVFRAVAKG